MKKIVTLLILAASLLALHPAHSANGIRAGVHYVELPFGTSVSKGGKVTVREFFWYGCPHCNTFEPALNRWRKSAKHVHFVRSPSFLTLTEQEARNERHQMQIRRFYLHARTYFALKKMGIVEKVHGKIFHAMHRQTNRLATLSQVTALLSRHGVDKKQFIAAMESDTVARAMEQSRRSELNYNIRSVPTLVIDGRYITSPGMAGGHDKAIAVVRHLVRKVRQEKRRRGR